jgi:hypothetical protein
MRKTMLKVFFSIVILLSLAQDAFGNTAKNCEFDPLKIPNEFNGIPVGQRIPKLKLLFEFYNIPGEIPGAYKRRRENLSFGSAKLNTFFYKFLDQKFVCAVITAEGENGQKLLTEAIGCYGGDTNPIVSGNSKIYRWTLESFEIYYMTIPLGDEDIKDVSGILLYVYTPEKKTMKDVLGWDLDV